MALFNGCYNRSRSLIWRERNGFVMLKSLGLKFKMLGSFLILTVVLAIVGVSGVFFIRDVSAKYEHVAKVNLPNAQELGMMQSSAFDLTRSFFQAELATDKADAQQSLNSIVSSLDSYEMADKAFKSKPLAEGEQELYETQNAAWKELNELAVKMVPLLESKTPENRVKYLELTKSINVIRRAHTEGLKSLLDFQQQESKRWAELAEGSASAARNFSIILVSGGILLSIFIGFLFANSLINSLRDVSIQIDAAATSTNSSSSQLSGASQFLAEGAAKGAASLEETMASLEELSSMVKLNTDHAKLAVSLSQACRQSAEAGETEIKKLITSVTEVSKSTKEIEEIINVIEDIAFQTNLLALNAAVEAARAGEHGKSFAVVAEAVRALAQKSAAASKNITKIVIDCVEKTENGVFIAGQGGVFFNEIVASAKKVADLNFEISTASQQQFAGLVQIGKAMNQLDQVTQSNAASAEEAAAASFEMSGQAEALKGQVSNLTEIVEGAMRSSIK